jgi:MinD superfamily P-loop ATPase
MGLRFKWIPEVRADVCAACGFCGAICPNGCLVVLDGMGTLTRPEACTSEAACISACPQGALRMSWTPLDAPHSIGRWRANRPASNRAPRTAAAGS